MGSSGSTRFDVERIRVSAEAAAYAALQSVDRDVIDRHLQQDVSTTRRALLANALLLTEEMAPEAYEAARAAMTALGVDDRIELFQSTGDGVDTARLVLYGAPIGIEFIGGYLDRLDHGGLLAVFGHEIGHCLAHGGRRGVGGALLGTGRANAPARRAYAMAAEFTADRFGLLACRDLHAVLRLEMQTVAGRSTRSIRFDTEAYLRQCRSLAEETIAAGGLAMGTSHPEHYIRGYAEWLFSESDVYRAITGGGPGSRSLDEVDAIIEQLIGTPRLASAASSSVRPAAHVTGVRASTTAASTDDKRQTTPQTTPSASRESMATGGLADAARQKLAAVRETLASVAGAAVPSNRRFTSASRDQLESSEDTRSANGKAGPDLRARFEEMKRRAKSER